MSGIIKLCLMAMIAVTCLSIFVSQTEAIPLEVSKESTTEATVKPATECAAGNPCGWAVYGTSKSKKTQYFIRNTCRCKPELSCLYSNEDLSLTAYVYRCDRKKDLDKV